MYSSARKMAMLSFVLAILSTIATVLLLFYFTDTSHAYTFTEQFTWILYTATTAVGSLFLSWGLFDLSKDLDREYETNAEIVRKLNKRISALENKEH